ncbi:hypothetical protein QUF63_07930 [Anaerolineales bacterium HSG25]|nr:hypothetical protein [Anaerolineales bacterium HSG25]
MPTIAEAKQAADQGLLQQARLMYEAILQENNRSEEAWLGLAEVVPDKEQQQQCYQKVLRINPRNARAKDALRDIDQAVPSWVSMVRGDEEDKPSSAVLSSTSSRKQKKSKKSKKTSKQTDTSKLPILIAVLGISFLVLIVSLGLIIYFLIM